MFCNTNTEFVPVATNVGNDGYGGGWMWAIILFFGLLVFGGGGWFGNRGSNGGGVDAATAALLSSMSTRSASADAIATDAAVQRGFDTQNIVGKLDGINNGLCNGFYTQNTTMLQGFAGVDNAICSLGYANQQGFNGVNMAIAQQGFQNQQCCCETNRNIDAVRYENAKNACDIIQSQNAGVQRILDKMCQQETQSLRDTNLMQAFQLSQQAQNATLISTLQPTPKPTYLTCSPYQAQMFPYAFGNGFNGCNSGCCGCNG